MAPVTCTNSQGHINIRGMLVMEYIGIYKEIEGGGDKTYKDKRGISGCEWLPLCAGIFL